MNPKQKEIFERITEIRDRMTDAKCELALLRKACEQLKRERDEAIERAEKAEDTLRKIEQQIPTWGVETDFSDAWLEVERLIIEAFSPKLTAKGEASHA